MRVLPILLSRETALEILRGHRTSMRKVVKPKYGKDECGFQVITIYRKKDEKYAEKTDTNGRGFTPPHIVKPPYQVGDVLWVQERCCQLKNDGKYFYATDRGTNLEERKLLDYNNAAWKSALTMPKEAARIWLKITDVYLERLQDISDEEAKKEGANFSNGKHVGWEEKMRRTAAERFAERWDVHNNPESEKYSWNSNPWVWVIHFEKCEKLEKETK